jgi:hypothetical protein
VGAHVSGCWVLKRGLPSGWVSCFACCDILTFVVLGLVCFFFWLQERRVEHHTTCMRSSLTNMNIPCQQINFVHKD